MVNSRAYYVGVLLSASRNPLNRIQFFLGRNKDGRTVCYSRSRDFDSRPDRKRMQLVGLFSSERSAIAAINDARQDMGNRGISIPGTKIYRLK